MEATSCGMQVMLLLHIPNSMESQLRRIPPISHRVELAVLTGEVELSSERLHRSLGFDF
jgi:hypothetical protein